jgi:O-antigen/teichoic acid export membrane protein
MITQLISLIAGVLTRNFLGPVQMGVWSLLQLILIYSAYSPLGVTEGISREIPLQLGKKDFQKADEIKDVVFTFALFTSSLIAAGVVIYALVMRKHLSAEVFNGLLMVSAVVIIQRISNLYVAFLRGFKCFSLAAKQMIVSAVINAVLIAALAVKFRFYGFIWAMFLSFVFNIAYIHYNRPFHFRFRWNNAMLWDLMKLGFPVILASLMSSFFLTIDKIMIAQMLGLKELGFFTVALMIYSYMGYFPNSIGIVLIPNFHEKHGSDESGVGLKNYVKKSSQVFCDLMPLMIASGWFLMPCVIHFVMPEYTSGIGAMRYLIVGWFFLALWHPYSYFMTVIRKHVLLIPTIAVAFCSVFVLNYIAIRMKLGLEGIALATSAATFIQFAVTYFITVKHFYTRAETLKYFTEYVLKFIYMIAALVVLPRILPGGEFSLWRAAVQFLIFIVLYIPFLLKLNRELSLWPVLKEKLFERFVPKKTAAL